MDHVDIEVLLAHVLKKDRSWILAHPEYTRTLEQESQFENLLERRRGGEPVAYIVGEKEFYGRTFFVDPRVLIPRPSTEGLIELMLENVKCKMKNKKLQVRKIDTDIVGVFFPLQTTHYQLPTTLVDIGTGSGCIAITLACELPHARIIATDISSDALDVARENAKRHGVLDRIEFRQGDFLEPIMDLKEPFYIVSNPPYVSTCHAEEPRRDGSRRFFFAKSLTMTRRGVSKHEPPLALFAGPKGTNVLMPLIEQARNHPYCQGILLECQAGQVELLGVTLLSFHP